MLYAALLSPSVEQVAQKQQRCFVERLLREKSSTLFIRSQNTPTSTSSHTAATMMPSTVTIRDGQHHAPPRYTTHCDPLTSLSLPPSSSIPHQHSCQYSHTNRSTIASMATPPATPPTRIHTTNGVHPHPQQRHADCTRRAALIATVTAALVPVLPVHAEEFSLLPSTSAAQLNANESKVVDDGVVGVFCCTTHTWCRMGAWCFCTWCLMCGLHYPTYT